MGFLSRVVFAAVAAVAVSQLVSRLFTGPGGGVKWVTSHNLFLVRGNFAPVADEVYASVALSPRGTTHSRDSPEDEAGVPTRGLAVVRGAVPQDLAGAFIRMGPNPVTTPSTYHHWFDGDGMAHAVKFTTTSSSPSSPSSSSAGLAGATRTLSYHNHYVKNFRYRNHVALNHSVSPGLGSFTGLQGLLSLVKYGIAAARGQVEAADAPNGAGVAPSNTNIVFHDGRLLALVESSSPFELQLSEDGRLHSVGFEQCVGVCVCACACVAGLGSGCCAVCLAELCPCDTLCCVCGTPLCVCMHWLLITASTAS